ncbi:HARB1 nuclease, partial [Amia calva]|nr:HARB1 nuclease [Amia calva]
MENVGMSKRTFTYVCNELPSLLQWRDSWFRCAVPVEKKVSITIWKLATNVKYRIIGHLFGVTVCRSIHEVCHAVDKHLQPRHLCRPNHDKFVELCNYFNSRWGFPQCVGAIFGSYIPVIAPEEFHHDYFNKKGRHSVIHQGVIDGHGRFWHICVGFPRSGYDACVLQQSSLWTVANKGKLFPNRSSNIGGTDINLHIIGDQAYPLQPWLLKPYSDAGRLTDIQKTFNYRLSWALSVVENGFGHLKGRWRCLLKRNDWSWQPRW